jgi:hypothetical protein
MRFFNTFIIVAVAMTAFVVAAPSTTAVSNTATSNFNANNALLARTEDGTCPHAKRHTCGQYMLEDGTRQDFVSQVFNCIPREQFICHKFDYQTAKPTHPGETNHMVAAKIEPGCECWFYRYMLMLNGIVFLVIVILIRLQRRL